MTAVLPAAPWAPHDEVIWGYADDVLWYYAGAGS